MGHHQGAGPSTRMGSCAPRMAPNWLVRPGASLAEPARAASLQPTPQSCRTTMRVIWVLPLGTGPPANTATGRFFRSRTSHRPFRQQATTAMSSSEPPSHSDGNDSEVQASSSAGPYSPAPGICGQCKESVGEISRKLGDQPSRRPHNFYSRVEQTSTPNTLISSHTPV